MIQHPAILALTTASVLTGLFQVYAGLHGTRITETWDLKSGSDGQLELERRTYLISAILNSTMFFQILSLFLFIFTADSLHSQFTGAMCAAGSLSVNSFGYPVFLLKTGNCLLAGVWLIINHLDSKGYDYPLIKTKYRLLNVLIPLVLLETVLQIAYFINLRGDVITSCCGSLFSTDSHSAAGKIAGLPNGPMMSAFWVGFVIILTSGGFFLIKRRGGYLFSVLSTLFFLTASASLVSFICLYFYELPTHHCPFCILQKEYGYIGYALYATLLTGGISGVGVGALMPCANNASLSEIAPAIQRRLAVITMVMYLLFTVIVVGRILTTSFRLAG